MQELKRGGRVGVVKSAGLGSRELHMQILACHSWCKVANFPEAQFSPSVKLG